MRRHRRITEDGSTEHGEGVLQIRDHASPAPRVTSQIASKPSPSLCHSDMMQPVSLYSRHGTSLPSQKKTSYSWKKLWKWPSLLIKVKLFSVLRQTDAIDWLQRRTYQGTQIWKCVVHVGLEEKIMVQRSTQTSDPICVNPEGTQICVRSPLSLSSTQISAASLVQPFRGRGKKRKAHPASRCRRDLHRARLRRYGSLRPATASSRLAARRHCVLASAAAEHWCHTHLSTKWNAYPYVCPEINHTKVNKL
jgi:hypothetical protein